MERTLRGIGILPMEGYGLAARATGCNRSEGAMIRDRNPGTDCNRHDQATCDCSHGALNRRRRANPQMFSSGSSKGATGPELIVSGGASSAGSAVEVDLAVKS